MCSKINAELITEVEYKIKLQRKMEKYENLKQKKVNQRVKNWESSVCFPFIKL